MHLRPFCLQTADKPLAEVYYHEVDVPSTPSVQAAFAHAAQFEQLSGMVDVTTFVDIALRFTCLAYRRNAAGHGIKCTALDDRGCVEIQFSAISGAHAVLYLYRGRDAQKLLAVLSFKGSTANIDDWRHNLQTIGTEESRAGVFSDVPLIEQDSTWTARVHPGWRSYLKTLEAAFESAPLALIPEALRHAWHLPVAPSTSLWGLLTSSAHVERVLVVGHSLGGALASMTATRISIARTADRAASSTSSAEWRASLDVSDASDGADPAVDASDASQSPLPPLLVTFGCPMVGDSAFVAMQNRLTAPRGGLRVFNHLDPVPSLGRGLVAPWTQLVGMHDRYDQPSNGVSSSTTEGARTVHGGLPITLRNDGLTVLNPMANHLQYVCDTVETFCDHPVARARYMLPGMVYQPDMATRPPAPMPKREPQGRRAGRPPAGETPAQSWQERAGRAGGGDAYEFGDLSRSMVHWFQRTVGTVGTQRRGQGRAAGSADGAAAADWAAGAILDGEEPAAPDAAAGSAPPAPPPVADGGAHAMAPAGAATPAVTEET